jgi:hypothetical protein
MWRENALFKSPADAGFVCDEVPATAAVLMHVISRMLRFIFTFGYYFIDNLKAIIPNKNYDRTKTIGECGIFQLFG